MNELATLLSNPITIIAIVLFAFFASMAYLRHRSEKRAANPPQTEKPYNIADPYGPPKLPVTPPPPATLSNSSPLLMTTPAPAPAPPAPQPKKPAAPKKEFFHLYGQDSGGKSSGGSSEYIWE